MPAEDDPLRDPAEVPSAESPADNLPPVQTDLAGLLESSDRRYIQTERSENHTRLMTELGAFAASQYSDIETLHPTPPTWRAITKDFLNSAEQSDDPSVRRDYLASAIETAQHAGLRTRLNLVYSIYKGGLAAEAAAACRNTAREFDGGVDASPTLPPSRRRFWQRRKVKEPAAEKREEELRESRQLDYMADMFELPPHDAERFMTAYAAQGGQPEKRRAGKLYRLQQEVGTSLKDGSGDHDIQQAAFDASLKGERIRGSILDPLKIERYGLQMRFIEKQAKRLFGTTHEELTDSVYARTLARHHKSMMLHLQGANARQRLERTTQAFGTDITDTFMELSAPVVAEFSLDGADTNDPGSLTYDQRIAWRFRTVSEQMRSYGRLMQYLDPARFERDRELEIATLVVRGDNRIREVWDLPRRADGAVSAVRDSLTAVMHAAMNLERRTGITLSPDHILGEVQANRHLLLTVAAHNMAELQAGLASGGTVGSAAFELGKDGQYRLRIATTLPDKGSLDTYAAATLGCPAISQTHASRNELTTEERLSHGSSNYADHVLAVSFQEARRRGFLDIRHYDSQPVPIAAKRVKRFGRRTPQTPIERAA